MRNRKLEDGNTGKRENGKMKTQANRKTENSETGKMGDGRHACASAGSI
jgi:hypothetical protein